MEDKKTQAEALVGLIQARLEHQHQTRIIEFKVNLALWAGIIVVCGFLFEKKIPINQSLGFLIGLFIALFHIFWMISIQISEDRDGKSIAQYRKAIFQTLEMTIIEPPRSKLWSFFWVICESGFTIILLILATIVLSHMNCV